jgi:hypothetical protein
MLAPILRPLSRGVLSGKPFSIVAPLLEPLAVPAGAVGIGGIWRRAFWSWPRRFGRALEAWARQVLRADWSWKRVAEWRPGVPSKLKPMELVKAVGDDWPFGFDFSDSPIVYDGEAVVDPLASGVFDPPAIDGLTLGALAVNDADFDDIPAEGGLVASISGGVASTVYDFAVIGTTVAGHDLVIPCRLTVVPNYG